MLHRNSPRPGLRGLAARLRADTGGAVVLMLGLAMVPLIGVAGTAVDYSRASKARVEVQKALDSAALAGAGKLGQLSVSQIKAVAEEHAKGTLPPELRHIDIDVAILENETAVRVSSSFGIETRFVFFLGFDEIRNSVVAEARRAIDSAEIALALDVTGTMRAHIPALQRATREFVDILQPEGAANANVKIALVPYVAAVNVSGHPDHMRWMDIRAEARHHGENFERWPIPHEVCEDRKREAEAIAKAEREAEREAQREAERAAEAESDGGSQAAAGGGGGGGGGGSGGSRVSETPPPQPAVERRRSPDLGFVAPELIAPEPASPQDVAAPSAVARGETIGETIGETAGEAFAAFLSALGPSEAQAGGSWIYGRMDENTPMDCDRRTPAVVNHFHLFDAMGVAWGGCVEARPDDDDLDVLDTPPRIGVADSWFVPFLWPDEHDDTSKWDVRNNYLPDGPWPSWVEMNNRLRQAWLWKYDAGNVVDLDTSSFLTRGPNAACPQPVTPLTHDRGRLTRAVGALRSYAASGTNIAEGMAWAWRMISPTFLPGEAQPYADRNRKYIVLMTDGFNEVVAQDGYGVSQRKVGWNDSDYSAIGYADRKRFGTDKLDRITTELDERLEEVCANVQDKGVRVFTVLFDPVGYAASSDVEALLAGCASQPDYVYRAATSNDLIDAFRTIGQEINALRLSR